MINLLPPPVKSQIYFAKLNRITLSYLRLVIIVILIIGAIFAGSIFYLNNQTAAIISDVATKQKQITATLPFQKQAKEASDRLKTIAVIQGQQTRFSLLLSDIAKIEPKGVSIDGITLTGDDKKPVRLTITANSYDAVIAFREAAANSTRINGADVESISQSGSGFQAIMVVGFKPGLAR